jgi:hypothetical protein
MSLDDQRQVLALIERGIGRKVDLATACGLGRRDRQAAMAAMDRTRELA